MSLRNQPGQHRPLSAPCRVLALEPYFGGSHRAFLEAWQQHSRHQWTVLTLPAHHWKWRMRHAAVTFANQAIEASAGSDDVLWDVVFCTDMLPLAEWRGLLLGRGGRAARQIAQLPCVFYFHENQLTYPVRHHDQRDLHFAFNNIVSALAASQTWFNSAFHREEFFAAAESWLKRLPDYSPLEELSQLRSEASVQWPGTPECVARSPRRAGPLRVAWAARWEHDKGLETLVRALTLCLEAGVALELSIMGEQFQAVPSTMQTLQTRLEQDERATVARWGFQSRPEYQRALLECDVFVSTAEHEFFGLSVVEAMAAGAIVTLPQRLSYPELLEPLGNDAQACFYDGGAEDLATRLQTWSSRLDSPHDWIGLRRKLQAAAERFAWPRRASEMDHRLAELALQC